MQLLSNVSVLLSDLDTECVGEKLSSVASSFMPSMYLLMKEENMDCNSKSSGKCNTSEG